MHAHNQTTHFSVALTRRCRVSLNRRFVRLVYALWHSIGDTRCIVLVDETLPISPTKLPLVACTKHIAICKRFLLCRRSELRVAVACLAVLCACDMIPRCDTITDTALDRQARSTGMRRRCQDFITTVAPQQWIRANSLDCGRGNIAARRVPQAQTLCATTDLGLVTGARDIARFLANSGVRLETVSAIAGIPVLGACEPVVVV